MGYYINVIKQSFRLKEKNKRPALLAIKALKGKETCHDSSGHHFSWVNAREFDEANTLDAMLEEWRYKPKTDLETGDIVHLEFTGEKLGDCELMFDAIAPFVEDGSFIEYRGEDGARWKYVFNDGKMKQVNARVVYDDDDEEEDEDE